MKEILTNITECYITLVISNIIDFEQKIKQFGNQVVPIFIAESPRQK